MDAHLTQYLQKKHCVYLHASRFRAMALMLSIEELPGLMLPTEELREHPLLWRAARRIRPISLMLSIEEVRTLKF